MRLNTLLSLTACLIFSTGWGTTICIDPGHPSEVGEGTHGKYVTEMHVAWEVALRLKKKLVDAGYQVVLTKSREKEKVTNRRRAQIANDAHADYVVRLHCDYAPGERGIGSFVPRHVGHDGAVSGPSAKVIRESNEMGSAFHRAMIKALGGALRDRGLRGDEATSVGGKHGALIGSIHSLVPVVLVEMCVLDSRADENFIRTESGTGKMASSLFAGIEAALKTRQKASTAR